VATDTVQQLNSLLADFTVFYQKLRHYHWNVTGQDFFQLHAKFEEMYNSINDSIDEIAERIVGLEGTPLHTLAHVLETASLDEDASVPAAPEMVQTTISDLETLRARLLDVITAAEGAEDRTTVNLLDDIRDGLDQYRWMLEAWLAE